MYARLKSERVKNMDLNIRNNAGVNVIAKLLDNIPRLPYPLKIHDRVLLPVNHQDLHARPLPRMWELSSFPSSAPAALPHGIRKRQVSAEAEDSPQLHVRRDARQQRHHGPLREAAHDDLRRGDAVLVDLVAHQREEEVPAAQHPLLVVVLPRQGLEGDVRAALAADVEPCWDRAPAHLFWGVLLVSGTGCVDADQAGGRVLTDVTLMEGALGRMNFVSWKRPLCCQFRTIGTL